MSELLEQLRRVEEAKVRIGELGRVSLDDPERWTDAVINRQAYRNLIHSLDVTALRKHVEGLESIVSWTADGVPISRGMTLYEAGTGRPNHSIVDEHWSDPRLDVWDGWFSTREAALAAQGKQEKQP